MTIAHWIDCTREDADAAKVRLHVHHPHRFDDAGLSEVLAFIAADGVA